MSNQQDIKLQCLKIAAEAASRVGSFSPTTVLEQAKGWYQWVVEKDKPKQEKSGKVS